MKAMSRPRGVDEMIGEVVLGTIFWAYVVGHVEDLGSATMTYLCDETVGVWRSRSWLGVNEERG